MALVRRFATGSLFLAGFTTGAMAETITYTYDAQGRVVSVVHSSGPANGVSSNYSYDAAGNRTTVTTSGASH